MKSEYKDRVQKAIADSGLSYSEIARQMGEISPQGVRAWAIGQSVPNRERIAKLAKITKTSEMWLLTGETIEASYQRFANQQPDDNLSVSVPVFNAKASAGFGLENFDADQVIKEMVFDRQWFDLNVPYTNLEKLSLITATGDSMAPTIEDGDYLLVDQGIDYFKSDAIYVAIVDSELYVKRFQKVPGGSYLMLSDNPKYVPITLRESNDVRFIGRVIRHWRSEKI